LSVVHTKVVFSQNERVFYQELEINLTRSVTNTLNLEPFPNVLQSTEWKTGSEPSSGPGNQAEAKLMF
jgi:hypothetical protein